MDETQARAELEAMTQAAVDPTLSASEVDRLLARCQVADELGRAPADDGYVPTYTLTSLNIGAAEGWRWKAAKAATRFDFATGTKRFQRSQVVKACQDQARAYARRIVGSAQLPGPLAADTPTPVELLP